MEEKLKSRTDEVEGSKMCSMCLRDEKKVFHREGWGSQRVEVGPKHTLKYGGLNFKNFKGRGLTLWGGRNGKKGAEG